MGPDTKNNLLSADCIAVHLRSAGHLSTELVPSTQHRSSTELLQRLSSTEHWSSTKAHLLSPMNAHARWWSNSFSAYWSCIFSTYLSAYVNTYFSAYFSAGHLRSNSFSAYWSCILSAYLSAYLSACSLLVSMLISFGAVDTFLTSTNSSQYEILATHSSERGFLFYEGTTL
jgi:hypothetical protein